MEQKVTLAAVMTTATNVELPKDRGKSPLPKRVV